MDYAISGSFVEACDCTVMCPCWLDDDPDEGRCTGLLAWRIGDGSDGAAKIDGVDVRDRTVVSVTTHGGNRRKDDAATVLFVDSGASVEQFHLLAKAFGGELAGPLGDLAAVSGVVLQKEQADIAVDPSDHGWSVTVTVPRGGSDVRLVHATGAPKTFEFEDDPLTLRHTALSHELGVPPEQDVTAHLGSDLTISVATLPGGYLTVSGRSGMTGRFSYRHSDGPTE